MMNLHREDKILKTYLIDIDCNTQHKASAWTVE
jgi:hypothetical protein